MSARSLIKQLQRSHLLADADLGGYFVATNPTPATALAFAVNASFDVTKGLMVLRNNAALGGKRMYLDYIKLIPTVAPASGTAAHFALYVDNINRVTSGGTAIVAVNANMDSTQGPECDLYAASGGTVITVATASSKARLVARGMMRSVIPAVGEEMIIAFGDSPSAGSSAGTAAGRTATNAPPVILGPQQQAPLIVWFPSNAITGLSYEFEVGWAEVP